MTKIDNKMIVRTVANFTIPPLCENIFSKPCVCVVVDANCLVNISDLSCALSFVTESRYSYAVRGSFVLVVVLDSGRDLRRGRSIHYIP